MKLKQISMMLCAASVFVGCNKDNNAPAPNVETGNTYSGLIIGAKNSGLRATGQAEYSGRDVEKKLTTLSFLGGTTIKNWTEGTANQDDKFWKVSGQDAFYTVKPWKTTPGTQDMAIIANKQDLTTSIVQAKNNQTYGSAGKETETITKLATDNKFVMTSAVREGLAISPKITEAAVKGTGTETTDDLPNNRFAFNIERVVAQGIVEKAADLDSSTKDGLGTVSGLKYAAVNGAVTTYLYANKAGERTMTNGLYKNYQSAIHDYDKTNYSDFKDAEGVKDKLIRLGNFAKDQGMYAAKPVADANSKGTTAGIYFLENSIQRTNWTPKNKDYGFYRMAYAKIYVKFTPNKVYAFATGEEGAITLQDFSTANGKSADDTFYKGVTDGYLYATAKAAKANGNDAVYTYKAGKCAYRALWNRQTEEANGETLVKNADTRRNNLYLLTIAGFETIGMPWDPSDPNDPNLPKPTPPEGEDTVPEGTDPQDPDIEKQDTYMRVIAKVIDWNLVTRDGIILE